jgi:hypothetical protein
VKKLDLFPAIQTLTDTSLDSFSFPALLNLSDQIGDQP